MQTLIVVYLSHYIIVKLLSEIVLRPHGTSFRHMVGALVVSPWCLGSSPWEISHENLSEIYTSYSLVLSEKCEKGPTL